MFFMYLLFTLSLIALKCVMYYFIQILYFITTVSSISTKTDDNVNFNIGFNYFVSIVSTTKSPPVQTHRLLQKIQNHKTFRKTEINKTVATDSEQKYDSKKSLYLQKYIPVASFFDENVVSPHFKRKKLSQNDKHLKPADIILRLAQRYIRMNKTGLFTKTLNNIPEKYLLRSNKKNRKDITTERNHNGRYKSTVFIDRQDIVSEKDSLRSNKKNRKDITIERNHNGQAKSTILTDTQGTITEKHSLRSNKKNRKDITTVKNHNGRYKSTIFIDTQDIVSEKYSLRSNKKNRKDMTTERNHNGRYKSTVFIDTQDIAPEKYSLRSNKKKRKDSRVERSHMGPPKPTISTDTQGTITEKHSIRSNKKKSTESHTVKRHTGVYKSTIPIDTDNSKAEEDALKNITKVKNENRHIYHHSSKEKRVDHQLQHFNKKSTNIVQNNKHKNEKSEDIATFSNRSFSGHSLYVEPMINYFYMNISREKEKKTIQFDNSLKLLLSSTEHDHKPSLQGHLRNKTQNHSNLSYKKHNTTHFKEENALKLVRNSNYSDRKFSKKVNNYSDRITQSITPSSLSIKEIEKPKPGTYKHANNTTSGLWQPSHKVKDDVKMYHFIKHIFKDKFEILQTVEEKTSDIEWKIRLKKIAESYEFKFKEFIEDIANRKVKSKSGNERVILNSIDMSNHLVMRVVRFVADEMDREGVLRNNETSNIIEKRLKHKTKSEMQQACTHFSICRRSTAFIEFITNFMTTLLSLDDVKFEKAYNFMAEHIQNTDFTNTIGYYADMSFKETAKKYEHMNVMYKRGSVEMLRNILVHRHSPLVIFGDNDKFDVMKTLAFIEIISILEKEVPNTEENETKWSNLTTELNFYRMGYAVNIEGTMASFVSHIKKVIDLTDSESWTSILQNLSTIHNN